MGTVEKQVKDAIATAIEQTQIDDSVWSDYTVVTSKASSIPRVHGKPSLVFYTTYEVASTFDCDAYCYARRDGKVVEPAVFSVLDGGRVVKLGDTVIYEIIPF